MDTTPSNREPDARSPSSLRALAVALLVGGAVLLALNACGTEDLVFPGSFVATWTPNNTATPVSTPTELP